MIMPKLLSSCDHHTNKIASNTKALERTRTTTPDVADPCRKICSCDLHGTSHGRREVKKIGEFYGKWGYQPRIMGMNRFNRSCSSWILVGVSMGIKTPCQLGYSPYIYSL